MAELLRYELHNLHSDSLKELGRRLAACDGSQWRQTVGNSEGVLTKRYKLLSLYFPGGMNTCLSPISEILVWIDEEMGSGGQVVWSGRQIRCWNGKSSYLGRYCVQTINAIGIIFCKWTKHSCSSER